MIRGGLTDLDELVLTCRTERGRDYIQEALLSYRAGAYRAAIIATWIAVVFDLVDKLRELDASGDAQAKAEMAKFDALLAKIALNDPQALKGALQWERDIIDLAHKQFQLLDDYQTTDMRRLFYDRNRCAHPTYEFHAGEQYRPSAELARAHIRNAIAHVLQQPPVQGKAAIEAILSNVRSRYFPTSLELVKRALSQQMERARPALIRGLVDRLIWDGFDGNSLHASPPNVIALKALLDLHRGEAEPRVQSQIRKAMATVGDEKLSIACSLVASLPEAWEGLDAVQRERFNKFQATAK
jgi:hypothetical protein